MIELILWVMITAILLLSVDIWCKAKRLEVIIYAMEREQQMYINNQILHLIEIYNIIQKSKVQKGANHE